jgi:hypothetical protein
MEFSPHSGNNSKTTVLDTTDESALQIFNDVVICSINSARQVIPEMTEQGEGALLFNLHTRLIPLGVFVGHLSISPLIKKGTGFDSDKVVEAWLPGKLQRLSGQANAKM